MPQVTFEETLAAYEGSHRHGTRIPWQLSETKFIEKNIRGSVLAATLRKLWRLFGRVEDKSPCRPRVPWRKPCCIIPRYQCASRR